MGNSDSLADRVEFRLLISTRYHPAWHLQGPPMLPHMASPACHPCHPGSPSVGSGSFRQDRCFSLPLLTTGSATPSPFTRLPIGSLPLQPAGLLGSLDEPLSGNSVLQVTLYTSLQLRGRTAEFPRPDSNWQVMCSARHTVRSCNITFMSGSHP
jgi:hypothetical protein